MSEEKQPQTVDTLKDATETMRDLLDNLMPPDKIEVTDVMGDTHDVPATCSARAQIKIMRLLETIKDLELPEGIDTSALGVQEIVSILKTLVTNETVFEVVCKCAELAHPKLINKVKEQAKLEEIEFDRELPVADLFPIEEVLAMIVPLFLRIAKRTGQAIQKIAVVT